MSVKPIPTMERLYEGKIGLSYFEYNVVARPSLAQAKES